MKALVTGATGFLGGALARRLNQMDAAVTGLGRNPAALARLEAQGIRVIQADLADTQAVQAACRAQDVVFHAGALSAPWGHAADFYAANVRGTENIIRGAMESNVGRLVYVSTPSIYFRFAARLNVREDAPLPAQPVNLYTRTKLLAEAAIDRAFAVGLPVITIRPRAIFGPGDTTILPRLIESLEKGRLRVIGDGQTITDLTYVENVVDALLLCAHSPATTLGKKYNITNGESVRLWDLVARLCAELGYTWPLRKIPYPLADALAAGLELVYRLRPGQPEPPLTRYSVSVLALSATLDISAARQELGYRPRVSVDEGFWAFIEWWKDGRV